MQILIDLCFIFSVLVGVYGLEQIFVNMIECVEVMCGGGLVLFGFLVIVGIINIIIKEFVWNLGQLIYILIGIGGIFFWDNNMILNVLLVIDNYKVGLYIFGQNRERSGYDNDGDGYIELLKLKNQIVGFCFFIKISIYLKLIFEYYYFSEFCCGGNKLN